MLLWSVVPVEVELWLLELLFDPVWSWVTLSPAPAPSVSPPPASWDCSLPCSVSLPFSASAEVSASFDCSTSPLFERSPSEPPEPELSLLWVVVPVLVELCVELLSFDPSWVWVTSSPEPAPSVSPLPADCSCSLPCSVSLPFSAPAEVSASFACSDSPLLERSPLPEPVAPVVLLWSVVAVSVALCVLLLVSDPVCV